MVCPAVGVAPDHTHAQWIIVGHHVHSEERIHDRNAEGFYELVQRTESVSRTYTCTHQHQGAPRLVENLLQFCPDCRINTFSWFIASREIRRSRYIELCILNVHRNV